MKLYLLIFTILISFESKAQNVITFSSSKKERLDYMDRVAKLDTEDKNFILNSNLDKIHENYYDGILAGPNSSKKHNINIQFSKKLTKDEIRTLFDFNSFKFQHKSYITSKPLHNTIELMLSYKEMLELTRHKDSHLIIKIGNVEQW